MSPFRESEPAERAISPGAVWLYLESSVTLPNTFFIFLDNIETMEGVTLRPPGKRYISGLHAVDASMQTRLQTLRLPAEYALPYVDLFVVFPFPVFWPALGRRCQTG